MPAPSPRVRTGIVGRRCSPAQFRLRCKVARHVAPPTTPPAPPVAGLTVQTAALTLIIGGGVLASRGDLRRLAALWAVFLPVDTMFGVDPLVFDCIRYGGAIGLVLFTRVD